MSSLVRVTGVRFRLARHLWDGLGLARGPRDKLRLARRLEGRLGLARGLCGGINPYTLTAKLGLARIDGFSPPER